VGVESDDDLLCVKVETSAKWSDAKQFRSRLSGRLPRGCELLDVKVTEARTSFQPCAATYILAVRRENFNEQLKSRIKRILASDGLNIRRQINARGDTRNVDVRPFLESIEFDSKNIVVKCKITSAGSIRVEEILKLLGLNGENLAAPIKRTSVQWQSN
jgi:Iap family predicted aminopeptidase